MKYKIKIQKEGKNFSNDLFQFLIDKSYDFRRRYKIDNIVNEKVNHIDYLKSHSPISVESVYGSTYQSKYRSNDQIYSISHTIESVEITDNVIFANIKPNEYGEVLDFDKGVLRPVYYKKNKEDKNYSLVTFDIDFNISP